jgi:hypothetical protein
MHGLRLSRLAVAVLLGLAYAWFYQGGGWNQNTRFALVRSIIEQGTLRIDDTAVVRGRPVSGDLARLDGHLYSDKAPGASFTAVPAVLVAGAFVRDPTSREGLAALSWVATLAAAGLPTIAAALLVLHLAMAFGCGRAAGVFAALAFGLATPAWGYATLLFGHALAGACLLASFAAAVELERRGSAARDWGLGLAVGLGAGWATVTEYPCAVPAAMLALLAVAGANDVDRGAGRRARAAAGVAVGALACIAVLAAYNAAAFGSPFTLGYTHEAGDFEGMKQGFLGLGWPKTHVLGEILFGRYRGLFFHAPVLIAAPVGLVLLVLSPSSRRPALAAIAIVAYFLLLNSAYFYWFGGAIYGPRHLAPALPFLALGLAAAWERAPRTGRALLLALALGSAAMTLVAVATTVQSPEWFRSPWTEQNWPAFRSGRLALNQMSFLDVDAVRVRDPIAHSWNLGEKMGLRGLASLVPLALAWAAIVAAWGWVERRSGPAAKPRR